MIGTSAMKDNARFLTGLTTAFCCLYVAWLSYHLGIWAEGVKPLLSGLGGPLPQATLFVQGLRKSVILAAGLSFIIGLLAKEFLVKSPAVRNAITFLVFMAITWFAYFCLSAILESFMDIMRKVG